MVIDAWRREAVARHDTVAVSFAGRTLPDFERTVSQTDAPTTSMQPREGMLPPPAPRPARTVLAILPLRRSMAPATRLPTLFVGEPIR